MIRVPASKNSNVIVGSLWMVGISLALFFLPLVNGLVGGLVGGYKVGGLKRALVAAIVPAIVVTVGIWVLLTAFGAPLLGLFAGTAIGIILVLADLGIFLGAAIGGWAAQSRRFGPHEAA